MRKKISGLLLFTVVMGLLNYSCSGRVPAGGFNPKPTDNPSVAPSVEPTSPAVGSEVDIKFLQTFNPSFAAGMKYTEIVTITPANKTEEISKEITAVTEETLKVKVKNAPEKPFSIADFTNPSSEATAKVKFKYVGKEDIKVPFAEYKGATKISLINANGTFTGWLATGIGTVKKTFIDAKKVTTKTELKEFKSK